MADILVDCCTSYDILIVTITSLLLLRVRIVCLFFALRLALADFRTLLLCWLLILITCFRLSLLRFTPAPRRCRKVWATDCGFPSPEECFFSQAPLWGTARLACWSFLISLRARFRASSICSVPASILGGEARAVRGMAARARACARSITHLG